MRTYYEVFKRYPLYVIVEALDEYYGKIFHGFNKYDIGFELKVDVYDKHLRDFWYGTVAEMVTDEAVKYLSEELCYTYIIPTKRKRIYPTSKTICADAVRERLERKLQNNTTCGMCCRTWDDIEKEKARKKEKTVQDVFNELTEEQKNVVYFMIGEALKSKESELKSKDEEIDELKEDLHNAEYQVKCWTRRCDELQKRLYEVKGVIEE